VERPFDEDVLLQLACGNRKRAARYIRTFAASLPAYRRELHDALAQHRYAVLRDHAHDLAGAAAYCGANPLYRAAKQLDVLAHAGSREELASLVEQVTGEIDRLVTLRLDRFE
jgi:HPt (histidine-containing phosphotransfer) domain-containing protein